MMVDNQFIFIGFDKKSIYLYNIKIVVKYTYNIFVFIEERMSLGGQIMGTTIHIKLTKILSKLIFNLNKI